MQVTAEMILSDFGAKLPLDRRRRDALADYCRAAAGDARSKQRWLEVTFDLKDYEAKDILKGNSSEAIWERMVKHPNGGWPLVFAVYGAVLSLPVQTFFHHEKERAAHAVDEARRAEQRAAELETIAARSLAAEARDVWAGLVGRNAGVGGAGPAVPRLAERPDMGG